jgi:hypothetical protein
MSRDNRAVAAKLLEGVGKKRVKFAYPGDEGIKNGILKDRAFVRSPGSTGVPYWDVVDLIEFPGEAQPRWIRIGYYREKPRGRLRWGSQTTITEPVEIWRRLLVHAAKRKRWFRRLLEGVVKKVAREAEQ